MRDLVIAEKPSVARDIAKVLGCKKRGEGFLEGDRYLITWAIGHLVGLCEPEDYSPVYKQWSAKTLPIIPEPMKLKAIGSTYQQYNIVKNLMHRKDIRYIICATDAGREGELIFRYIYTLAQCKKPIKRLWISSLTNEAIAEGFQNLKDGSHYDNLYLSAKCRSESDWLVGINASRAYTIKYKELLSIGRVQTPTLAIIVNREKEIEGFVPEDYWELKCNFGGYEGLWFHKETRESKIDTLHRAVALKEKVEGQTGYIKEIDRKKIHKKPPMLYDLTELQRDANKKYGFTAEKTLNIAQSLYEKRKAITYPRTDSKYLSKDLIKSLKKKIEGLKESPYRAYCEYLLAFDKLPVTKRIVDDTKVSDHHAIIPTDKKTDIRKLSGDEGKIFHLIVTRFLAAFYPDYVYQSTTITTEVKGEYFKTIGQQILDLGWRAVFTDEGEKETDLPFVQVKDQVNVRKTEILQKQTQPPKRYNESMLLSAMENAGKLVEDEELKDHLKENGIGTPATRAGIIERLIQVGYVIREGKNLIPTEKGKKLIELVPKELSSPELTGKWEKALNKIAKGTMDQERFMEDIRKFTIFLVQDAQQRTISMHFSKDLISRKRGRTSKNEKESLGTCPACNTGTVMEGNKNYYCSNYQIGCKFGLFKDDKLMARYKKKMTKTIVKQLIKNGQATVKGMVSPKNGGKFEGKIKLKQMDTGYWGWEFDFSKDNRG